MYPFLGSAMINFQHEPKKNKMLKRRGGNGDRKLPYHSLKKDLSNTLLMERLSFSVIHFLYLMIQYVPIRLNILWKKEKLGE